jgi:hypothetical protein
MRAHGAEMSWTAPDVFPATLETAEEAAAAAVLMAAVALGRRRRVTERDKKLSTIQQLRDETRRDERGLIDSRRSGGSSSGSTRSRQRRSRSGSHRGTGRHDGRGRGHHRRGGSSGRSGHVDDPVTDLRGRKGGRGQRLAGVEGKRERDERKEND